MKILLATPAYGGILTTAWFGSFMKTMAALNGEGHELAVLTEDRDALISRSRNHCATVAMENGFDKLLFIDADNVWEPEQVLSLLSSDKKIIGGTYPYKSFPIRLVFNPMKEHEDFFGGKNKTPEAFSRYVKKCADENGEIEVTNIPTGFLLIDVGVLKELAPSTPQYSAWNDTDKARKLVHDFFPITLTDLADTRVKQYNTEDWGFCSLAKAKGFKIYLHTKCVIGHIGHHEFRIA